ncbi:MAG: Ig-like domain-containing protein [Cyclobacteriaceae bacterium]|nr:Ig-like domain-containing protein [Cyclobacteriaceae bacterium]
MPEGGPKDETPPNMVSSTPIHEQLNYTDKIIKIEFDEFIQLKEPEKQILITPRLTEKPEFTVNKKTLTIKINEELQANTTYSLNFREAVQDVTERNPARNLKLAFSTGDIIDTLYIKGSIFDLFTQKPIKDAVVALYQENDTTNILNSPPSYLTLTDENGYYSIDNLKSDLYKIYSITDKNSNSVLEYKNEKYGFISQPIKLDSSINNVDISLYNNDKRPLNLISARTTGKYFVAKYNKGLKSISIQPDTIPLIIEKPDINTIKFYNNHSFDSIQTIITAMDSSQNMSVDTIYVKFTESPRKSDPYQLNVKTNNIIIGKWLLESVLTFNKPTQSINQDSIYIKVDSLITINRDSMNLEWLNNHQLKITTTLKNYLNDSTDLTLIKFNIGKKAFVSVEADTSDKVQTKLIFKKSQDFGTIEVAVKTDKPSYIIQITDNNLKVIREIKNINKYTFSQLEPSTYKIRVLIDNNNNGEWELGDITKNTQPEEIYIYSNDEGIEEIPLRANFILGPLQLVF